jgi:hypothetical protein
VDHAGHDDPGEHAEVGTAGRAGDRTGVEALGEGQDRRGVVGSWVSHPIEPLRAAGVAVRINTDDPLLFGTDVAGEYATCAATWNWGRATLGTIARTSIEAGFAPPERRRERLGRLEAYLGR